MQAECWLAFKPIPSYLYLWVSYCARWATAQKAKHKSLLLNCLMVPAHRKPIMLHSVDPRASERGGFRQASLEGMDEGVVATMVDDGQDSCWVRPILVPLVFWHCNQPQSVMVFMASAKDIVFLEWKLQVLDALCSGSVVNGAVIRGS